MFKKILIANRGEIAVRVIRACREAGTTAAVVFSDADRTSLAVRLADEAYRLGPPPVRESYLQMEAILTIAKEIGAEAIHPGYGFLAENPRFAQLVAESGLAFIGPPAAAIRALGDKLEARRLMATSGVPVVPGSPEPVDQQNVEKIAAGIGYPVLLKAAAGGGGKGMRVVQQPGELKSALRAAQSEARTAFGDDRIYVEKFLEKPRHIEVQIIADRFGSVCALGERECTIQRRHQKVVEESPSVFVTPELRAGLFDAARQAAHASGYVNAGTVEFLVDARRNYYFLEVNTRLQVEHPVTEEVTGLDLVRLQLQIASGEKLPLTQAEVRFSDAALECRIYAEDPTNNFFPSTGRLERYREPAGLGVRVDSGVVEGDEITLYYDPLIAKVITSGRDRLQAIERMRRALAEFEIAGVVTNLSLHRAILSHPEFLSGNISTDFLRAYLPALTRGSDAQPLNFSAAVVAALSRYAQAATVTITPGNGTRPSSHWKSEARRLGLRIPLR